MLDTALTLLVLVTPTQARNLPAAATINARIGQEDGKPELIATVMSDGSPLPNAQVAFLLRRSFGDLALGQDTTLDDGTAAAPFPAQLGADPDGTWTVRIVLTSPAAFADQTRTLRLEAPSAPAPRNPAAPRALWARAAPWPLILLVLALTGAAWSAYLYAAHQLQLIKTHGGDDV